MSIEERPLPGIEDSASQQALDDAKAGVTRDEEGNVVREIGMQGFDPRAVREEEEEKPRLPDPATADGMLQAWYLFQTVGRLSRVKMGGDGDTEGVDEGLAASMYVEATPGFRREIVLFAQQRRGEDDPWRHWYGNWPDNRRLAEAIYESFRAALAQRLIVEPFRILTTRTFRPDHLEEAEMANPNDLETRNKKWREELTRRRLAG